MTTAKSLPVTETTTVSNQVPATTDTPASESAPIKGAKDASLAVAKKTLMFPVALVVAAVFPLALGFGTVRLKASAASSALKHKIATSEAETAHEAPVVVLDRRLGDRDFYARRFEVALQYYRSLGSTQVERLPVDIQYRIALCHEGLGQWDEAMDGLRRVCSLAEGPALKAAASFGQARIFLRKNDPRSAASQLRSTEFQTRGHFQLPESLTREVAFLLPFAVAQVATAQQRDGFHHHLPLSSELIAWSLDPAIAWSEDNIQSVQQPADALSVTNHFSCRLVNSSESRDSEQKPTARLVDFSFQQASLRQILETLASECGWTIRWSAQPSDTLLDRTVDFASPGRPVSLALTSLCSELKSTWSLDGNQLLIQPEDAAGQRLRKMAVETLTDLIDWNPGHRLGNHVRYSLAQLAHYEGDNSRAATMYSTLVGRDSSPIAVRAAYHAGHISFQAQDYSSASFHLGYVVNGAPNHQVYSESLLLLGRLLLDQGDYQQAVFQLRRGTVTESRPDNRGRAAVLLGMAYLAQEKYTEAAEAILDNKKHFDDPEVRNAAAFVTTLARWQSSKGEFQEREANFMYRALASLLKTSDWLGQTGQMLIGRAFSELGFDSKMAEIYTHLLAQGATRAIEPELVFSLANYEYSTAQVESATKRWTALAVGDNVRWSNRARLRMAEVALAENRPKECVEVCQQIKTEEGIVHMDLCRMLGRAYEKLGDNAMAVRCYAGNRP